MLCTANDYPGKTLGAANPATLPSHTYQNRRSVSRCSGGVDSDHPTAASPSMAMTTILAQALFMHAPFAGRAVRTLFLLGLAVVLVACQQEEHAVGPKHINQESSLTPRPETQPSAGEDGNWVMPAKDYASTRFSGLDQINRDSVKQLGVTATFSTGFVRGHEAAPLVVNNTMYIVTPFPNVLFALDLATPGTPLKWKYEPKPVAAAQGVACCDVVNRGAAYANGLIVYNTLDNRTVAVD